MFCLFNDARTNSKISEKHMLINIDEIPKAHTNIEFVHTHVRPAEHEVNLLKEVLFNNLSHDRQDLGYSYLQRMRNTNSDAK